MKHCAPTILTTEQIANIAMPAVVIVENYNENGEKSGQGSGYILSGDGTVITNYHVIRSASALTVKVPSRGDFRVSQVLGYDVDVDVAALQLPDSAIATNRSTPSDSIDQVIQDTVTAAKRQNQEAFSDIGSDQPSSRSDTGCPVAVPPPVTNGSLPALATVGSPHVQVGDHVVAIGAPFGLENTVSQGIVSALRTNGQVEIIQTTASISPGSSGGPLLNDHGHVVGLTTSTLRDGQNLNFVISSRHIADLLGKKRQLTETRVEYPFPASTITVPARQARVWRFVVSGQPGALFEGTYTITGGSNSDVIVMLMGPGQSPIVNSGRVSGFGQFSQRLPMGQYMVVFDNRFSILSSKSISPNLKLVYYK